MFKEEIEQIINPTVDEQYDLRTQSRMNAATQQNKELTQRTRARAASQPVASPPSNSRAVQAARAHLAARKQQAQMNREQKDHDEDEETKEEEKDESPEMQKMEKEKDSEKHDTETGAVKEDSLPFQVQNQRRELPQVDEQMAGAVAGPAAGAVSGGSGAISAGNIARSDNAGVRRMRRPVRAPSSAARPQNVVAISKPTAPVAVRPVNTSDRMRGQDPQSRPLRSRI